MKKYAKEKNIEYFKKISKTITKTEEYKEYSKNFKEEENPLVKYLLKLSLDLPVPQDFNRKKSKNEINIEILNSTGEYLDKVQKLDEIKREYNNSMISEVGNFLGTDPNKNPFLISKNQLEMEFSKMKNEKLDETEVQVKSSYWENKLVKTVEGLRNSILDGYSKKHKFDKKVFKEDVVYKFNDELIKLNFKPLDVYEKYIMGKITREQLEQNKSIKQAKEIANKLYKEKLGTNKKADLDFLLENKLFGTVIDNRYLIKDTNIVKSLEMSKENNDVRLGIYKEAYKSQSNDRYFPCGFSMKNYNGEVIIHMNKRDYKKHFNKDFKGDYENTTYEKPIVETALLYKYTPQQLKEIRNIEINKGKLEKEDREKVDALVRGFDLNKKDEYMKEKIIEEKENYKSRDYRKTRKPKDYNERGAR